MVFLVDLILLSLITLLLVFNTALFQKSQNNENNNIHLITKNKASFFIYLRFVQWGLFVSFIFELLYHIITLLSGGESSLDYERLIDNVVYVPWVFISPNLALLAFREIIVLTGIFYLSYLQVIFARYEGTNSRSFFYELPWLVAIIIYALRFLISTNDIFLMLLLLEIVSFCSIVLIGSQLTKSGKFSFWPVEAALKYFLIGGLSLLIFAIAAILCIFLTGNSSLLTLTGLKLFEPHILFLYQEVLHTLLILLACGFFLKLGLFPFYQWLADVYDGSDMLITILLMGVISPALLFKVCLFVKDVAFFEFAFFFDIFLNFIGITSILIGTIGAFSQTRLKRFLAYTSLTHMGFVVLFLSTNLVLGYAGALLYIFFYILMIHGVFSLLVILKYFYPFKSFSYLNSFKVLIFLDWFLVIGFIILCFSFAGIPPFAGFFTKYFLLLVLLLKSWFGTVGLLVPIFIINAYLYIRVVSLIFFDDNGGEKSNYYLNRVNKQYYKVKVKSDVTVQETNMQNLNKFANVKLLIILHIFIISTISLIIVFWPFFLSGFWVVFCDFLLYI